MKKWMTIALAASALACVAEKAVAQNSEAILIGTAEQRKASLFLNPVTTVKVRLEIQKESVRKGPYARFAQKYLGVIAPLSDKDNWSVKRAVIDYQAPNHEPAPMVTSYDAEVEAVSHIANAGEFLKVSPDKMEVRDKSLEEMAAQAANTIFTIRKRRFELISGEAGENVFGQGLASALDALADMEQEYLSLFLGKTTIETAFREFDVVPEGGKNNYVVCRFSSTAGVLSDSDLGANPIVLDMKPQRRTAGLSTLKSTAKNADVYQVAEVAACRVMDGNNQLASATLPVFQWGVTVETPVAPR